MPPSSAATPEPIERAANRALAAVPVTWIGTVLGRPSTCAKCTGTPVFSPTRTALAGLAPAWNRPAGATLASPT